MKSFDSCNQIWSECLRIIKDNVEPTTFDAWFAPLAALKCEDKTLTLRVPSSFFYEYLEEHFVDLLQHTLYKVIGEGAQLMYHVQVVQEDADGATDLPQRPPAASNGRTALGNKAPGSMAGAQVAIADLNSQLNPNYTFENFIEGESNLLARNVAQTVAETPAKMFNPLFVHGASGVGKTHLCNAIGNRVKLLHPQMRVLYVSAHLFKVQYVDAVLTNRVNDFIHFYQQIDLLIIDDIQEWGGQTQTQNTFFHIFNHLYLNRKQLVFSSDRAPFELQGIEQRLITRFKSGMVAEMEKPTPEMRISILRDKIRRDGLHFPDDVIRYIAEHVSDSVRDLEGVIISLMAHATMCNREIDMELAQYVISRSVKRAPKALTVELIVETVCNYYNVSQTDVQTKNRKRDVVNARQVAMFLSDKYTDASSGKIGQLIGGRDHATVLHAYKVVKQQMEVDKSFRSTVDAIEKSLMM